MDKPLAQDGTPRNGTRFFGPFVRHWPLWGALAALWITTGILQYLAALRTQGHLIYALDDAYIHMAMAKNLALHGVYGVTRYEFTSSSSSPLWTLLLALFYFLFGVHESFPFILNLVIASVTLVAAYVLLNGIVKKQILQLCALLAIVFFTPLPVLIASGMEHPLHILLAILFLSYAARTIVDDTAAHSASNLAILFLLCAAIVLTRFESYALVFVVCALFALRKRWTIALGILVAGLLPLIAYQAVSVAHGWQWLPNSILVRAGAVDFGINSMKSIIMVPPASRNVWQFLLRGWNSLLGAPFLAVLIAGSILVLGISWRRSRRLWKIEHIMLAAYVVAALAHVQFGRIGYFFRYEAYLVALGVFVLPISVVGLLGALKQWMASSRMKALGGAAILLLSLQLTIPLFTRSLVSLPLVPIASQNIYQQQYQMGLFLRKYYSGKVIAANDIGAICFLADIHLVDLVGLASVDIYRLRESNEFNTGQMLRLCNQKDVSIVVAYAAWLHMEGLSGYQQGWKREGEWKIENNVVCGNDVVSFYATQTAEERPLMENLLAFSKTLPPNVGYRVTSDIPSDSSGVGK
jgi:4-amino-4-deoxy-L-arabinose transferase-like glycosyltransferase